MDLEDTIPVNKIPFFHTYLIAACATSTASFFTNPLEVVKTRTQLQNELLAGGKKFYKNPIQAFYMIGKNEGIAALQTGLLTSLGYQVIMGGLRISLFEPIKNLISNENDKNKPSLFKNMIAATSAGFLAAIVANPMYLMKSRLQAAHSQATMKYKYNYKSGFAGFQFIYKTEGFRGFFHGIGAAIPRAGFGSASQLVSYDFFKNQLLEKNYIKKNDIFLHTIASLAAGIICVSFMNPFDVICIRLYNQPLEKSKQLYTGPWDCCVQIIKTEGITGMFKGWSAQYLRLGPQTVLIFVLWEQYMNLYKTYYLQNEKYDASTSL